MNRTALKVLLVKHEGLRLKPYRCTAGKLTIGVGRNLDDRGITEAEAAALLDNDVNEVWKECSSRLAQFGFGSLDDTRQHVLLDLAFNLGVDGLLKFRKFLAALGAKDFNAASREMLDSTWAKQVGDRAVELATMMKEGA